MSAIARIDAGSATALADLHAASFARPWTGDSIATLIGLPGMQAWAIAESVERPPQGFLLIQSTPPTADLVTVAIAPDMRGRGMASALLRHVMAQLAATGHQALLLEVAADNAAALALYERLGFTRVGVRPRYYRRPSGPAVDAVVMRAALAVP